MNKRIVLIGFAIICVGLLYKRSVQSMGKASSSSAMPLAAQQAQDTILIPGSFDQRAKFLQGTIDKNGLHLNLSAREGISIEEFNAILTENDAGTLKDDDCTLLGVIKAGDTYWVYEGKNITNWVQSGRSNRMTDPSTRAPFPEVVYYLTPPAPLLHNPEYPLISLGSYDGGREMDPLVAQALEAAKTKKRLKSLYEYEVAGRINALFTTGLSKLRTEASYEAYKRYILDRFTPEQQQSIINNNVSYIISDRTVKLITSFQPGESTTTSIKALSFSPDGKSLAVALETRLESDRVKIYNVERISAPYLVDTRTIDDSQVQLSQGWGIRVPFSAPQYFQAGNSSENSAPYGVTSIVVENPTDRSIVATASPSNWQLHPIAIIVSLAADEDVSKVVKIWQKPDLRNLDLKSAQIISYVIKNKIQDLASLPKYLRDNLNSYATSLLFSWYQRGLNWVREEIEFIVLRKKEGHDFSCPS